MESDCSKGFATTLLVNYTDNTHNKEKKFKGTPNTYSYSNQFYAHYIQRKSPFTTNALFNMRNKKWVTGQWLLQARVPATCPPLKRLQRILMNDKGVNGRPPDRDTALVAFRGARRVTKGSPCEMSASLWHYAVVLAAGSP